MFAHVEPAPTDDEREAILAALRSPRPDPSEGGWAAAALLEGVDDESEPDHP